MLKPVKKTIDLGDGRQITIETGKLAKQADGAVEVRMGNTMLLATVCSAAEANEGVDFMPLTVEYKEKYASIGRYPADSSSEKDVRATMRSSRRVLWTECSVPFSRRITMPRLS